MMLKRMVGTACCAMALLSGFNVAHADKLDDVIDSGKLRCGVVLDFPPIGFRNEKNEPVGYDVDYCKDLAASLGVEAEIIPVTWAERLPLIVSNRGDVVFGAATDTLDRAKTVGFSIPYGVYHQYTVVRTDSNVKTIEDIKDKRVAASIGTYPEQEWLKLAKKWGVEKNYQGYQSENEVFLAVAQGKADVGLTPSTSIKPVTQQFKNIVAGPELPFVPDYTSVIAPRKEQAWLNYINLFINHQVRTGRYAELWEKYVGGEAPTVTVPGVYY